MGCGSVTLDSYLTTVERESLLKHLSEYGTNYDRYLRWASERNLGEDRIYSQGYLKRLYYRKRDIIRRITEENYKRVRRDSTMDRAKRIEALEDSYTRLEKAARGVPPEDIVNLTRIEEQKRKVLESISKERGEFGKGPEDNASNEANMRLHEILGDIGRAEKARVVNP